MNTQCPNRSELLKVFEKCPSIHEVATHYGVSWSTVRCWLRWLKIDFKPDRETLLKLCKTLTDKKIGEKYKVTDKTVTNWKKEYSISKNRMKMDKFPSQLSDIQQEVIIGKLLGDGWIGEVNKKNRSKNTYFGAEHSIKSLEYVEATNEIFKPFSFDVKYRTRKNNFKTKPHHKDVIDLCFIKTVAHLVFTQLRQIWYPKGHKIIPRDIDLTWRTIAFWYCDDGSNALGKTCCRRHGILCTNGFTEDDVEFLIKKLNEKQIKCHIYFDNCQPMIHLHKDTFEFFLSKVEPFIPWECMKYKLAAS